MNRAQIIHCITFIQKQWLHTIYCVNILDEKKSFASTKIKACVLVCFCACLLFTLIKSFKCHLMLILVTSIFPLNSKIFTLNVNCKSFFFVQSGCFTKVGHYFVYFFKFSILFKFIEDKKIRVSIGAEFWIVRPRVFRGA